MVVAYILIAIIFGFAGFAVVGMAYGTLAGFIAAPFVASGAILLVATFVAWGSRQKRNEQSDNVNKIRP